MSRVCVIVPCYNEADRLDLPAFRAFARQATDVQLLMVNDGSNDGTLERLRLLERDAPRRIRVLNLAANVGKAEAVRLGILKALDGNLDYVGFLDADLATPLDAIPQFRDVLDRRGDVDVVIGTRIPLLGRNISRTRMRTILGNCFARAASLVLGMRIRDTQCGAKLFRAKPHIQALFREPFVSRWIFDVEIVARLIRSHRRQDGRAADELIYEFPLDLWQDVAGSKLRGRDFLRAGYELALIYRRWLYRADADTHPKVTNHPEGRLPQDGLEEVKRAA